MLTSQFIVAYAMIMYTKYEEETNTTTFKTIESRVVSRGESPIIHEKEKIQSQLLVVVKACPQKQKTLLKDVYCIMSE